METILTEQPQQDDAIFAGKTKQLWSRCSAYTVIVIAKRVTALFYQFRVHNCTVHMPVCHIGLHVCQGS
jgi:hypothetical protein